MSDTAHLWTCPACGNTTVVDTGEPLPEDPTDVQPVCDCGEWCQLDDGLRWSAAWPEVREKLRREGKLVPWLDDNPRDES